MNGLVGKKIKKSFKHQQLVNPLSQMCCRFRRDCSLKGAAAQFVTAPVIQKSQRPSCSVGQFKNDLMTIRIGRLKIDAAGL